MASKYTLTTQPTAKAVKFAFYGPEGVGKTTLASKLPGAVTIDTEGSTAHMTLCRYPRPKDWAELMDMVDDAGRQKIGTLIIDTLDWADILCTRSLCKEKKWDSIEAAGYGKGYVMLGEKFAELLAKLSELADRGINVGFCAHAQLRKIEKPEETGAYDHWELKCSKKVAPLVKEWADLILFCNYDTVVIHGNNPMEANRITGNKRVMYANHAPTFDAKNRFGLPDKMPLDYEPIKEIFERAQAVAQAQAKTKNPEPKDKLPDVPFTGPETGPALDPFLGDDGGTDKPLPEAKPEAEWTEKDKAQLNPTTIHDRFPELEQLMEASGVQYSEVQAAVSSRGYFPGDMPIEMYPADFVKGCLVAAWDSVKKLILDMRRK
jgi:hypothetical protein